MLFVKQLAKIEPFYKTLILLLKESVGNPILVNFYQV